MASLIKREFDGGTVWYIQFYLSCPPHTDCSLKVRLLLSDQMNAISSLKYHSSAGEKAIALARGIAMASPS